MRVPVAVLCSLLFSQNAYASDFKFEFNLRLIDECGRQEHLKSRFEPGAPMIDAVWIKTSGNVYCLPRQSAARESPAYSFLGHTDNVQLRLEGKDQFKSFVDTIRYGISYDIGVAGSKCKTRLRLRATTQMLMFSCKF